MVALVGAFFLLDTLDIIAFNFAMIWPVLLIAFGMSVLVARWSAIDSGLACRSPRHRR